MKFDNFINNLESKNKLKMSGGKYFFLNDGVEYEFTEEEFGKHNFKYDILNEEYIEFVNRFKQKTNDLGFNEETKYKPVGMYFSERDNIFNPLHTKKLHSSELDRFDSLRKPQLAKGDPKNIKTARKNGKKDKDFPAYRSSSDEYI